MGATAPFEEIPVTASPASRRAHPVPLAVLLVATTLLFGRTADYSPAMRSGLAVSLLAAAGVAAWFGGARAIASADPPRRLQAVAGVLLIAPFALLSLLAGVGPPHDQPPADNALRFLVLAVGALLSGSGLLALRQALASAGETFWATLGAIAATWATPLYVVFALVQRVDLVAQMRGWTWATTVTGSLHELTALDALAMSALFLGSTLTWLASALFAAALGRAGWLGRRAAGALVGTSLVGGAFVVARGFAYPELNAALSHWYSIPGFVAGIPAVPWMLPCAMGVLVLRRADS